jgi:ABC-type lipoprotein release transport system permease subunit
MLISEKLAKELNAGIKSKIVITFQDYDGNLTGASFKVEGIFKTQNDLFDKQNVFVRKSDLDRILDIPPNTAHEIAVMLFNNEDTYTILPKIKKMFPEYLAEGWFDIDPYLEMSTSMTEYMLLIFMSIIMLALGFVIVNTMLMVVLERTRELGMIMAIGMNKKKVFKMIFYETSLLGFTGALLGIAISALFTWHFGDTGLNISSFSEGFQAFGYSTVIRPVLDTKDYIEVVILVFITGLIASVFPTIRALKMKPVEAIRE